MKEKVQLTKKGLEELKKELEILKNEKLPDIRLRLDEARKGGDLSENTGWDLVQEEYHNTVARIEEVEGILKNASVIVSCECSHVAVGSVVIVFDGKNELEYEIVSEQEANPLEGKISDKSLLGSSSWAASPANFFASLGSQRLWPCWPRCWSLGC